jgi:hypothetical protein
VEDRVKDLLLQIKDGQVNSFFFFFLKKKKKNPKRIHYKEFDH